MSAALERLDAASQQALRLEAVRYGGEQIALYEFAAPDGGELAPFTAGSHVDVHLPNGIVRQYSLANNPSERSRYVLGVKCDRASRGGSRYMHESLRVGTMLQLSLPRNNFPLHEAAPHTVLIAGGIGITPIRCMVHRLEALGLPWELHYAVRHRSEAVFAEELGSDARVHLHVDEEHGGAPLDLARVAREAPTGAHAYCCGPAPMISAFETAFSFWPASMRHVEHFSAPSIVWQEGGAFSVLLARTQRKLEVPADRSILSVVREAGIDATASCEQGICGACETRVLGGQPEHRDMLLSAEERAAGKSMMICCSRSKSAELVLDL